MLLYHFVVLIFVQQVQFLNGSVVCVVALGGLLIVLMYNRVALIYEVSKFVALTLSFCSNIYKENSEKI